VGAYAGISLEIALCSQEIPAFAGMTKIENNKTENKLIKRK
jgi:hypothetical protein